MKDGGRLAAAIEVLSEIEDRHRPAQVALRDWGTSHRFAGSGDRTAIGNLVFDALRNKTSLAARMGSASPRAITLSTYAITWQKSVEVLNDVLAQDRHAPEPLSEDEAARLAEEPDDVEGWKTVLPVVGVGGEIEIGDGKVGPVAQRLRADWLALVERETTA